MGTFILKEHLSSDSHVEQKQQEEHVMMMAHQGQRYDALATAVVHGDPLVEVPRGYKRQKLLSENFWMSYGEDPRPGMDGRPLYAELGRL